MNWKAKRAAALKAGLELIEMVKARDGILTDDERTQIKSLADTVREANKRIADAAEDEALFAEMSSHSMKSANQSGHKAKSLGHHWAHTLRAKGYNSAKDIPTGVTFAAPELAYDVKAATDVQAVGDPLTGAYGPLVTDIDRDFVMPYRPRLVIADLLQKGTIAGNTITYPVFGPLEGATEWVAEGGRKSQLHVGDPEWMTDSLGEIAGWFKTTDDMAEDLAYMVSEINTTATYDLLNNEEQALLFGTGTDNQILGITNRSGVQTAELGTDTVADAIFKSIGKVQTVSGLNADGVVMNPTDYEALRLSKDANNQYYAGGMFAGQYGNGDVMVDPPIWGRRTIVTAAIPAGKVLVGAFSSAKMFTKGGIRVESTNSNVDDFINDKITTRLRKRVGLQVKYPSAFVLLDLATAGA